MYKKAFAKSVESRPLAKVYFVSTLRRHWMIIYQFLHQQVASVDLTRLESAALKVKVGRNILYNHA